jgi:hypothetical protein
MQLPKLTEYLVSNFDKMPSPIRDRKITVNPIVAEIATWYEKIRNAMDYREDEVMMRSAVERILKRRLLLSRKGKDIASSLIRELAWARYFPDSSVPETLIIKVEESIDLFFKLEELILKKHKLNRAKLDEWILHLLSSDITVTLNPPKDEELMSNFMYQLFYKKISIINEPEETRDVQVFIGIRKAFAKDDLAFLRYYLFLQFFGKLSSQNLEKTSDQFLEGYKKINYHLNYPLRDRIYSFFKKQSPPFFILEDVFRINKGRNKEMVLHEDELGAQVYKRSLQTESSSELELSVYKVAQTRYSDIHAKVKRAIVRSVIFILVTKAVLALAIEGTYESFVYGHVQWLSIAFNTLIPPILMIIVGASIKTPNKQNTDKIFKKIKDVLFDQERVLDHTVVFDKKPKRFNPVFEILFSVLWLVAFLIGFGGIVFILNKLEFNIVSQAVFLFFIAIMAFLSYRIYQIAHKYTFGEQKENIVTVLIDFFFMPFVQVGKGLTYGISQINVVLLLFDFIIETPFKGMFSFFEQWFIYLRSQREKLD